MQKRKLIQLGLAAIILFTSCNNNKEETTTKTETTDTSVTGTEAVTAGKGTVMADIDVTITGGDLAGTYSADCKEGCCSWGIAGEKVFGNQYSETGKGPKELSSVQLIVDNVEGNKSTKEFTVTVSFGELFGKDSKSFNINTRNGNNKGSGTLDLQYAGDRAVVTIKGVSEEGPSIDLKMECHKVGTMKNLGQ